MAFVQRTKEKPRVGQMQGATRQKQVAMETRRTVDERDLWTQTVMRR